MNQSRCVFAVSAVLALAASAAVTSADDPPSPEAAVPHVTVVMNALNNPRGLAVAPNGAVFVAEAGRGAPVACTGGGGTLSCYGHTGAVSRYWKGRQDRVVTGLPSIAFPKGNSARGPHDIAMLGLGTARVTVGMEADPATRETLNHPGLAWLIDVPASTLMAPSGHLRPDQWSFAVDLGAFEATVNPHPRQIESDPYSLLAEPGGYVATDASGNDLVRIDEQGNVSALAVFPSKNERYTDSVPTSVTVGPDGAYYVSEFTGFGTPQLPNSANIYRVVPGEAPTVFCSGFNRLIDIAFDADGSLWVLQHWTLVTPQGGGVLYRVIPPPLEVADRSCPDRTIVNTGVTLDQPTSIALAPDAIYISNRGNQVDVGEVLRIDR